MVNFSTGHGENEMLWVLYRPRYGIRDLYHRHSNTSGQNSLFRTKRKDYRDRFVPSLASTRFNLPIGGPEVENVPLTPQ